MSNLAAFESALESIFAEPLSPEGGGGFAAPAPIPGGRKWARLLIGAMTKQGGSLGGLTINSYGPTTLRATNDAVGWVSLDTRKVIGAQYRVGEFAVSKLPAFPISLRHPIFDTLFTSTGYSAGSTTTRAASPTDITLTLEGDTVRVDFSPPLKVSKSVLSFSVARLNVTESRVHIVVDGFLGKDQYLELGE